MADVAHDASGPSPKPGDIAPQQASRPDALDRGKLRVFISYSRDDLEFADQLDEALNACGFECLIDRHGISGGEEWKRRLGNLISEADTVVFVLSPSSARSEICAWEVEEAARLNKRILPVNCRPLEGVNPPPRLRDLNYIFFYKEPAAPGSGFGNGLAKLIAALNTDFDWLREHTRYLQRAMEWDKGGRPANRLLSGNDILDAKAWVVRRPKGAPEPTALQLDFIRASEEEAEARLSEQRKQLEAIAAAQAERETALHDREEALKQRARVARVRNFALVAVSILFVLAAAGGAVATWSYVLAQRQTQIAEQQKQTAEQEKQRAEQQKEQADDILKGATNIIVEVQQQMNDDTKKKVFALFQMGANHGDVASMENLGFLYAYGFGVPRDYANAREWFEKAAAKDNLNAMNGLGMLFANGLGVPLDYAKAREWFEKAAAKDHAQAMYNLGILFRYGQGVVQDLTKTHELYEKAAAKDYPDAMNGLGTLYHDGEGVTRDYAKAHEWYEKAAAKDYPDAMANLGVLFANGLGVPLDYAKARDWLEKAAARGDERAKMYLVQLPIREAFTTGRYAEALQRQEAFAAQLKPGEQTAGQLTLVIRYALFAKEFTRALTVADRAHALLPDNLEIETNRAHALMFLGSDKESRALYLVYKGKRISGPDDQLWERAIAEDFAEFRKAGLTHPMMAEIEKELGVSP